MVPECRHESFRRIGFVPSIYLTMDFINFWIVPFLLGFSIHIRFETEFWALLIQLYLVVAIER